MKIQLALDDVEFDLALDVVEKVHDYIDIIEVGTPLIIKEGVRAIAVLKDRFPDKEIFADLKIMDGGCLETIMALEQGADYVTVLGVSDKGTIGECVRAAASKNKKIVIDMLCVKDVSSEVSRLEALGAYALAVHTGVDQQALGRTPLQDLREIKALVKSSQVFVAGGISEENVALYAEEAPDVIIVGGGICKAKNPALAAKRIHETLKALEKNNG